MYVINTNFKTYESDIRALLNSFFPGEELVFIEGLDTDVSENAHMTALDAGKAMGDDGGKAMADADTLMMAAAEKTMIDVDQICAAAPRHAERFEDKSSVKKALYQHLCALTGRTLPWGTLTGIRPVRIIERYEDVMTAGSAEPSAFLHSKFLVSEEKARLLTRIYANEQKALSAFDYKSGMSIYIGIPFCPTRCVYCSFTSYPFHLWENRADEYIDAVRRELMFIAKNTDRRIDTIYIGGGTPSVLSAETIDGLIGSVEEILDLGQLREFTFEAGRPDTISIDKLKVLKKHGVDRISINPQTMNEATLRAIGRRHGADDIVRAFGEARELGFDNINMDVIAGLPGEGLSEFEHTLQEIEKLGPDNLTVHTLAIKRASALNTSGNAWGGVERKGLDYAGMEEVSEMIRLGAEYAGLGGMEPYYIYRQKNMAGSQENTGYAKPGKEGLYNILMMEEKQTVLGVGAGSSTKYVSYDDRGGRTVRRSANVKNTEEYLKRMAARALPALS